jgi:hypothetical protein
MACIQYPRKERGGVSLPSWEQPTIYKEPPKEIFTRKKERIEEGDITYNIRNDASRINDSLNMFARSQNPMVAVDYQNRAPQTTTMNFGSASNPYKVNQSFRPPLFRLEDLQPLSRQRREWTAVQTNLGSDFVRDDQRRSIDPHEVVFSTSANHLYHAQQSNVSREQGVYQDNFNRTDMLNDNYVVQNILSKLKGIDSVELQKMFQYEQTPNGIVLSPVHIEALANMSGTKDYEAQRNLIDLERYTQEIDPIETSAQLSGVKDYEAHRQVDTQKNIQSEMNYYGAGSGVVGQKDYEAHRTFDTDQNIQKDILRYGQGTNVKGMSKQEYVEYQKEKMKDVLLKNIKSAVAIVVQTSGDHDGYQINANVQDKIAMIVNSAMGQSISLERDNGDPIRLKDYTWKYVKSSTGADTFIIQADMPELKLDRKTELYAAQTSMSHNIHVPIMNTVELKTERINTAASTNVGVKENIHNASRADPELMVRKAEKDTTYTDWMVQSIRPTMDRVDTSNLRSEKKQNINKTFIREMDGRFDS